MITSGSDRRIDRKRRRERHLRLDVDLYLVDAGQAVLDRILDGDDVDLGSIDLGQGRVERRGLSRACRPGHEQRPGRPADDVSQLLPHRLRHPERLEGRRLPRLVDEAHDDLLALDRRQHRDANVEHAANGARVQGDPPVLRLPALGDVELREHLQARRDAVRHSPRDPLRLAQHAVDPDPDDERVLLRLEVDVAGAVGGGLHDDGVDEAHERSIRDAVVDLQVVLLVDDLHVVERGLRLHRLAPPRDPVELGEDLLAVGDDDVDGVPRGQPQLVDAVDVRRIRDRYAKSVVRARDGYRDHTLQALQRDELRRARRRSLLLDVVERQGVAARKRARDSRRVGDALVLQRLCEPGDPRPAASRCEPVPGDELGLRDELGDEVGDRLESVAEPLGLRIGTPLPQARVGEVRGGAQRAGRLEVHDGPRSAALRGAATEVTALPCQSEVPVEDCASGEERHDRPQGEKRDERDRHLPGPGAVPDEEHGRRHERREEPEHQRQRHIPA